MSSEARSSALLLRPTRRRSGASAGKLGAVRKPATGEEGLERAAGTGLVCWSCVCGGGPASLATGNDPPTPLLASLPPFAAASPSPSMASSTGGSSATTPLAGSPTHPATAAAPPHASQRPTTEQFTQLLSRSNAAERWFSDNTTRAARIWTASAAGGPSIADGGDRCLTDCEQGAQHCDAAVARRPAAAAQHAQAGAGVAAGQGAGAAHIVWHVGTQCLFQVLLEQLAPGCAFAPCRAWTPSRAWES